MNKFRKLSDGYATGTPYDNTDVPEVHQYCDLHEAYGHVYLEESEMKIPNYGAGSVNWSKYRKRLIEILKSDDFDITIHTKYQKKYGIETFNSSLVLNASF